MEMLYGESSIERRIRQMFAGATGRRVVLTAFVGVAPRDYLGDDVRGIAVYCWTHGNGGRILNP